MPRALDIQPGGEQWLPYALQQLSKLHKDLERVQQQSATRKYPLPDGNEGQVTIRTWWLNGQWHDHIRITACQNRQGFLLRRDGAHYTAPYQAYYTDGVVERLYPADGSDHPDPPATERTYGYKVPEQLVAYANSASRYSGLMRAVVGCYHVRGENAPFSYYFPRTHGILKFVVGATTVDPYDQSYIVEVSASGVFAAPISNAGGCCNSWGVSQYMPSDDEIAADPSLAVHTQTLSLAWAYSTRSTVHQLLTSTDMTLPYTRNPFVVDHGWAFNYSGTEAQVVTQEFLSTPARRYDCSRFRLNFSLIREDEIAGGVPACSLTAVEVDRPVAFRLGQLWIPEAFGVWEGTQIADTTSLVNYPSQDGPIEVFYRGDEEEVIRFQLTNYGNVTHTESEVQPGAGGFGYYNYRVFQSGTHQEISGGLIVTAPTMHMELTPDTFMRDYDGGVVAGFYSSEFNTIVDARPYNLKTDTLTPTGGGSASERAGRFGPSCLTEYDVVRSWLYANQVRTNEIGSPVATGCVVLFLGEREAVLCVQSLADNKRVITSLGDELNAGNPTHNNGQFAAFDTTWTVNGVNTCGVGSFASSPGAIWPYGFFANLTVLSDVTTPSASDLATLIVGAEVHMEAIGGNTALNTFGRTGSLSGPMTAYSEVFAMHGNLYNADSSLIPPEQYGNRAIWLHPNGLTFYGGFAAPIPGDAHSSEVVAFVGKA